MTHASTPPDEIEGTGTPDKERVLGLGGVFFRARRPEELAAWYGRHLGLDIQDFGGVLFRAAAEDMTVWSPMPHDSGYIGDADQHLMINYRVRDLDAMLAQLRAAGVPVDDRREDSELGKFGWATDPEGNRFELWQPPPAPPGGG